MIQSLRLSGYRSLRDLRLRLGRVTVIRGANGVGKTNIYRALRLLSVLARGDFTEAVAAEGGMRSLLWAGNKEHARVTTFSAEVISAAFTYEFECGLRPATPGDLTAFKLDPDIKLEALRNGKKLLAKRTRCQVRLADSKGTMHTLAEPIGSPESMLALIRDLEKYPSLLHARLSLERWRFYHAMRTDPDAPARMPVRGCWSPVLAEDASNLPSVIQTINESNEARAFHTALDQAFHGSRLHIECADWFHLAWQAHDLPRTLAGHELSDGTLQFICLAAVLCSPKPPPLFVLNEPETSLNESVFPALADLVLKASEHSQIIIISHSQPLCTALAERCKVRVQELTMRHGDTRLLGQEHARACYVFDDDDDPPAAQ
ncbi:AAA family ATPase [Prosthecobacter sp.]|uniref:AAA family ATPase n=1 Tax=Prosthecobacter sp. TaxID=1965333 RepID=UPI003784F196